MKRIKTNQDVLITIEVMATTSMTEGIIILINFRRESNVLESAENEFFQDFFTFQWIAKVSIFFRMNSPPAYHDSNLHGSGNGIMGMS